MDAQLWTSLVAIVTVWALTVLLPGPNFLASAHTAATRTRAEGVAVAGGIALGTAVWASGSLLGLGVLFQTAAWLYQIVKWCGAAFLVYVGLKTILSAKNGRVGAAHAAPCGGLWNAFRRGLVVDLSNPKAAAFFASLFSVAVPPLAPLWFKASLIGLVVLMAGGWYACVAVLVTIPAVHARLVRAQRAIAYVSGALFVALGARLALEE